MTTTSDIKTAILATAERNYKARSAWGRGVIAYVSDILDNIHEGASLEDVNEKMLLNGARTWAHYAVSGCGLCYNAAIAERMMTPSEFKRWESTSCSSWDALECETRALLQAWKLISSTLCNMKRAA